MLGEFAQAGRIGGYGVATWAGFIDQAFTVAELIALASEAAGSANHHLAGIQLPVSLVTAEPIAQALDGAGPLVHARDAGIVTWGAAPPPGGGRAGRMTPPQVNRIPPGSTPPPAPFQLISA
ncbi:hypothetical protein ACIBEC_18630, partial [Kitasatospora sp. NPDC051164]